MANCETDPCSYYTLRTVGLQSHEKEVMQAGHLGAIYWALFSDVFGSQLTFLETTEEITRVLFSVLHIHGAKVFSNDYYELMKRPMEILTRPLRKPCRMWM